eukprot:sb/3462267/
MYKAPSIRAIDKTSIHNICSGQVIVTLATAVKELVENSIDAHSTSVQITFRDYGKVSIEVSDDGSGISPENFGGLTLKHHTSKIRDFEDISEVGTFGFRGEALSSLCALGDLSVTTSTGGAGSQIKYNHEGSIVSQSTCARGRGTTVTIENLFSTLPVRHKEFIKNIKKEYHKAVDGLQAYAMISTNVRLHCVNIVNKRKQVVFSTQSKSSLKENVISILSGQIFRNLTPLSFKEGVFKVSGYISKPLPKHGRGSADKQYFFINNRPCDHDKLAKTVNSAFRQYEKFQYPVCVVVIEIRTDHLDVNVTPDKRKMFLENENILLTAFSSHLDEVFQKFAGVFLDQTTQLSLPFTTPTSTPYPTPSTMTPVTPSSNKPFTSAPVTPSSNKPQDGGEVLFLNTIPDVPSPSHVLPATPTSQESYTGEPPGASSDDVILELFEPDSVVPDHGDLKVELFEPSSDKISTGGMQIEMFERDPPTQHNQEVEIKAEPSKELVHTVSPQLSAVLEIIEPAKHCTPVDNLDVPLVRRKKEVPFVFDSSYLRKRRRTSCDQESDQPVVHFVHQVTTDSSAEKELSQTITKSMFKDMKILGQFNLGFILTRLNSNLFIIDQHATDEKYRFETLKRETKIDSQKLVCPKPLRTLNGAQEDLLISYLHIFNKNGFEFRINEEGTPGTRVALTALPRSKSLVFDEGDVEELLWLLSEDTTINRENLRPSKVFRMFASRACRSAVMVGTALSGARMGEIVGNMGDMDHPWNCPHGRPTMRHLVDLNRLQQSSTDEL